ncbi:MAG: chromate transporter [Acidobacteria bacterium]|nr:chromate transporter [Acidobacteriota bacterium]MBV9068534.1 chromate transporter [Acidobacteriota bacterium]MBV9186682.1 chromate transporter [Acidobacteriota bacterium]
MRPTLIQFVLYFLRLGALGFGGPVALTNALRRDLVETREWLMPDEFENGLALAAACPGPLAYQLGIYCGYIRFGIAGGLAVAVAFGLPPFVIVTAAASLYVRFAADWHLRALFYGIAPAIVALIIKACWNLGRRTLRADRIAWIFAIAACAITVIVQRELALMFVAAGLLGAIVFAPTPPRPANAFVMIPSAKLFAFFFKTGLLVFGSGLVIVPFLKTQVVDQYHWLTNRQFLDSVAIGMISPGPVVITATFVGYLLNGFAGAAAATLGIFSPPILFTVIATPILLRYHRNPRLAGFIRGVGVTVVGVLVGTSYLIALQAIGDWLTMSIAIASLVVITMWKRIPEPAIIAAAGAIGLLTYQLVH